MGAQLWAKGRWIGGFLVLNLVVLWRGEGDNLRRRLGDGFEFEYVGNGAQVSQVSAIGLRETSKTSPKPSLRALQNDWSRGLKSSNMSIQTLKRLYSRIKARRRRNWLLDCFWTGGFIPGPSKGNSSIFPGFDPEAYSIWFAERIADTKSLGERQESHSDHTGLQMESVGDELIDNFLPFSDICFGIMGTNANNKSGIWMFPGDSIPPMLPVACPAFYKYRWTKANVYRKSDVVRINQMLCQERVDGLLTGNVTMHVST
ncbi:hypothetical protein AAMO2058_000190400 [Amorphochlora amoebiformis]